MAVMGVALLVAAPSAVARASDTVSTAVGKATVTEAIVPPAFDTACFTDSLIAGMRLAAIPRATISPLLLRMARRAMASDRSTPRVRSLISELPIRVRVELAAVKGQYVGREQMRVKACKQVGESALVRRGNHQHA